MSWEERIPELRRRQALLTQQLADPAVLNDSARLREAARDHSELAPFIELADRLDRVRTELREAEQLAEGADDPEMQEMARAEAERLREEEPDLTRRLRRML